MRRIGDQRSGDASEYAWGDQWYAPGERGEIVSPETPQMREDIRNNRQRGQAAYERKPINYLKQDSAPGWRAPSPQSAVSAGQLPELAGDEVTDEQMGVRTNAYGNVIARRMPNGRWGPTNGPTDDGSIGAYFMDIPVYFPPNARQSENFIDLRPRQGDPPASQSMPYGGSAGGEGTIWTRDRDGRYVVLNPRSWVYPDLEGGSGPPYQLDYTPEQAIEAFHRGDLQAIGVFPNFDAMMRGARLDRVPAPRGHVRAAGRPMDFGPFDSW